MNTVFDALADPQRRELLDRLRVEGALSVSDLAAPLPISRQGVTKHIDVLVGAGLVTVRREGRRRLHELQSHHLRVVADWLAPYEAEWDRRLDRLKAHVEGVATPDPSESKGDQQ